ncbi:dihydrolipoamide acetyltransferase family protein [Conexibacter sp. CPCC 206217]|uniref:dihydrolipoamide acetyltransferase family protein n=1 Tax=Conexibacter sp. CPCC 206217 TaxID=3064574 RepID=UPI0027198F46|nr:dihydrolipoamide acetyltransferase family protein [Conexibacter sp. CPCC 206217]MDO8212499.1 dihydrolipoamide acetyltransferase family protein [Conexibacter sp. CPCC 206217]
MSVEILMPRLSDAMEEATVVEWLVAEGEQVSKGQPLVEIETDKATVTHEADADGVLLRIVAAAGSVAALGETIAIVGVAGEAAEAAAASVSASGAGEPTPLAAAAAGTPPATAASAAGNGVVAPAALAAAAPIVGDGRVAASPLARRVAADLGIDLAGLVGTGPSGRVVRADVERAATEQIEAPAPTAAPATPSPVSRDDARDTGAPQPLTRTQATIARRMVESRTNVPEFELRVDVDMSACIELREQLRTLGADPLPSYNDIVVKASALALREHPLVNGGFEDGAFVNHGRVNVGVAVATEGALLVPTVYDADRASLGEIARTTRALAGKVREGKISPAELDGGTFTVSNLGMFDIDSFTAVVNEPQAAILAVGSLAKRAVVVGPDDDVVARPMVTLTLACDHRIIYGADGARFLARLRDLLEQPLAFML